MLVLTSLSGFGGGGTTGVDPVSVSLADHTTGITSSGSITFSSASLGSADSTRWIYVCVTAESNAEATICTVGGTSATLIAGPAFDTGPLPDTTSSIFGLAYASGTSADVVVTMNGFEAYNIGITVVRVVGGVGTQPDTYSADDTQTATIDIPADGGAIVCVATNGNPLSAVNCTTLVSYTIGSDTSFVGYKISSTELLSEVIGCSGSSSSNSCATAVAHG